MHLFVEYAYVAQPLQAAAPSSYLEAMKTSDATACDKEMDSLNKLKVYKLVPRSSVPPGKKIINSKWVMRRKSDNSFKARMVAQGWGLKPGVDCGNTFAPVCMLQSVRMVLAIVADKDWEAQQMDATTAFLYADILQLRYHHDPDRSTRERSTE